MVFYIIFWQSDHPRRYALQWQTSVWCKTDFEQTWTWFLDFTGPWREIWQRHQMANVLSFTLSAQEGRQREHAQPRSSLDTNLRYGGGCSFFQTFVLVNKRIKYIEGPTRGVQIQNGFSYLINSPIYHRPKYLADHNNTGTLRVKSSFFYTKYWQLGWRRAMWRVRLDMVVKLARPLALALSPNIETGVMKGIPISRNKFWTKHSSRVAQCIQYPL